LEKYLVRRVAILILYPKDVIIPPRSFYPHCRMSSTHKKGVGNMKIYDYIFVVIALAVTMYCSGLSFAKWLIAQKIQKMTRFLSFVFFMASVCLSSVCFYYHILYGSVPWLGDVALAAMFALTVFIIMMTIFIALYCRYRSEKTTNKKPVGKAGSSVVRSIMLNF